MGNTCILQAPLPSQTNYCSRFACNIVSTTIIYFWLPETKGKSMEEMGDLFGDKVVVHMSKDGNHLVDLKKELTNDPATDGLENMGALKEPHSIELETV